MYFIISVRMILIYSLPSNVSECRMRISTFLIYSVTISLVSLSMISAPLSIQMAQAKVYEQNVSCIKTGLTGNVPGGTLSGSQAFDILNKANSLAIELIQQAESTLFVLPTIEPGSANPTTVAALQNRFGLGITDPAHLQFIPKLEFEYKQVKDYLDGGYTLYICRDPGCPGPDTDAFVRLGGGQSDIENHTLHLCSAFWNSDATDQAGTILHEAFHIHWDQVNDQGFPQVHNAHCFEQFALDLKGIPINERYRTSCTVPGAAPPAAADVSGTTGSEDEFAGDLSDDTQPQEGGFGESTGDSVAEQVPTCDPTVDPNCTQVAEQVPTCDPTVDANCPIGSGDEFAGDFSGDTPPQDDAFG
jgi:hypothetical protein